MIFHFVSNINCEFFLVLIFLAGCSASTSWAESQKGGRKIDEKINQFLSGHTENISQRCMICAGFFLSFILTLDRSISISHSTSSPILLLKPMLLLHVCLEKMAIASGLLQNWRRNMHQISKLPCTSSWIAAASEPISDSFFATLKSDLHNRKAPNNSSENYYIKS